MSWLDWLIVLCASTMVAYIGVKSHKYVKGVSDFLSAGRVAGRYVVAVAHMEAAIGVVSLVALFEAYYKFWIGLYFLAKSGSSTFSHFFAYRILHISLS